MKAKFQIVFFLITIFSIQVSFAQATLKGRIIEASDPTTGVAFANVILKGTTTGSTTDIDGYYEFTGKPGTYTVEGSFIGYNTYTKTNVVLKEGETTTLNFKMSESTMELDAIVLEEAVERQTESAIMLEQKNATEIVQAIGAQELSRKGVSDVAGAVTKVTGISKQEGSSGVFVRGLGDRYNSTSFNNLPLPSNNPSRKNISLGLFSTDIVDVIGINKIFSSSIYGDVGGANIDIKSKVHVGDSYLNISVGTSANTNALSVDEFYVQDGPDRLGFYNSEYDRSFEQSAKYNSSWDYNKLSLPIGYNFGLNGGRSFKLNEDKKIDVFVTASHDNKATFKEGLARSVPDVNGISRSDYKFEESALSANTTAMANFNFDINAMNNLKFNSLFINSANQKVSEYKGIIDITEIAENGGGLVRRQDYDKTSLFVNQLLGEHSLTDVLEFNWGFAYNKMNNSVPDRKYNQFIPIDNDSLSLGSRPNSINGGNNHRFYQSLTEDEFALNTALKYKFNAIDENGNDIEKGFIEAGFSGRMKEVDFMVDQVNYRAFENDPFVIKQPINTNDVDGYFNDQNLGNLYEISSFIDEPQVYYGDQNTMASFIRGQYQLSNKISATLGGRFENIQQTISWLTSEDQAGGKKTNKRNKFLPNLSAKYTLSETDNLKFGFSKTYTLPQYKERALFRFVDVTTEYVGNPYLYESDNYNLDLRWESFKENGTMYGATVYGKYIKNPINQVVASSASNDITWANTGEAAQVAGIELEFKKDIFNFYNEEKGLTHSLAFNANGSWIAYADQDFDNQKVREETNYSTSVEFTNKNGGITGASDLLLNVDLVYLNELAENKNIQASLSTAYFSDRLASIGVYGKGDYIEKAFISLNFNIKAQLNNKLKLGFSAKNLLNPTISTIQDIQDIEVLKYKKGRNLGFNLTYSF